MMNSKNLFTITFILLMIQISYSQEKNYISYEPVEGMVVGIWPHENKLRSPEKLNELKDRYGFNYILIAAPYGEEWLSSVRKSNYDFDHVMKQLYYGDLMNRPDWFWKNVEETGKVWAYYFDEPISRKFPFFGIVNLMISLIEKGYYPHAQFVVGELDERKAIRFDNLAEVFMYSGYGTRGKLGLDQKEYWNTWRNYVGPKFSQVWISTVEDSLEYRTLLQTAKEMGMTGVWLYQYEPLPAEGETSDANLRKFCEAAAEYGYLRIKKDSK